MYGPVIQGELVRLRPPRPEDAPQIITWFEDIEVLRFLLVRHPPGIEEENEWVKKMAKDPDHIVWIVEFEGRSVGVTGIHAIDWRNGFATTGTAIGDKTAWGRGVGREVMQLRARYAFTQQPFRKLKSGYIDGNVGSAKAQAAAGYKEVGRYKADRFVDGEWRDHILTELHRSDWEAR